jgi:prepilin-type N-terminal cleavage/methylation domain-containing protein
MNIKDIESRGTNRELRGGPRYSRYSLFASRYSLGFSLIELLVAAAIFSFIAAATTSLFVQALDLQRRATGIQKISENTQFVLEAIAREVRVSTITSGDTNCDSPDASTRTLVIQHPTNGEVIYQYEKTAGIGSLTRDAAGEGAQAITSEDVNLTAFAFCVMGSGADGIQARVTMPMTLETIGGRPTTRAKASLQTTVVSRDLTADLTQ